MKVTLNKQEITVKIIQTGSQEDCNNALAEARQFVFKKIVGKVRQLKSEDVC